MTFSLNAQTLDYFQWKNRLVVIIGEISDENRGRLKAYASLAEELTERKLEILVSSESGLIRLAPDPDGYHKHPQTFINLKKRYPKYTILLIGLDGGVKRKTNTLFEPKELFGIIDAMPMRASEIRRKNE